MRYLLLLFLVVLIIQTSVAPPVEKKNEDRKDKENEVDDSDDSENPEYQNLEYHRYLKEVIQILERDSEFRAKLENAKEEDIRTGKIAHELQFVDHKVRSKLDELKRQELERLRHLATKEYNHRNDLDIDHLKIAEHLDHFNAHTFEIDDLKKLIAKTTKDLAEVDKRRRQQFKEYEMQKKFEEEQKMKGNTGMKEEERKKYEEELEVMKKKHKDHKPLHHPGSKQQLEEVWEKQDHMEDQEFNPKTFFHLHDLDGNGYWDQNEVKALFLKELDKLYSEGAPEDDIYERQEEMERMREHVFTEADLDRDGVISYQEFLVQTMKPDFQQDEGWQGLDEQQIYSQQEYEAFQKHRQEEIQKMVAKGMLPPLPDTVHLPVQHEQFPSQYQQQYNYQQYSQQAHSSHQVHPSQQQYSGQISPQQPIVHVPQYQGQLPQQQPYQPQVPPSQQHYPGQIPQQQQYQGQQPQYQMPVPQQQQFQAQQPQQAQQQFQSQPQQVQQQSQGQPQQIQQQTQGQPQQIQPQQAQQTQPQQAQQQIQQQQTQNQVPQHTQSNVPSSRGAAQTNHNLPQQQDSKSVKPQINQNSIPNM